MLRKVVGFLCIISTIYAAQSATALDMAIPSEQQKILESLKKAAVEVRYVDERNTDIKAFNNVGIKGTFITNMGFHDKLKNAPSEVFENAKKEAFQNPVFVIEKKGINDETRLLINRMCSQGEKIYVLEFEGFETTAAKCTGILNEADTKALSNIYAVGENGQNVISLNITFDTPVSSVLYPGIISTIPLPKNDTWSKLVATPEELNIAEKFSKKYYGQFNRAVYSDGKEMYVTQLSNGKKLMIVPMFDGRSPRQSNYVHLLLINEKGQQWKEYYALVSNRDDFRPFYDFDGDEIPEYVDNFTMTTYKLAPTTEVYFKDIYMEQ